MTHFRFEPKTHDSFKDKDESASLAFEFYDFHMRDSFRDSKGLIVHSDDLIAKAEMSLEELFRPYFDMISESMFKEQLEKNPRMKGHSRHREDFMRSFFENPDVNKIKSHLAANGSAISNMSWSVDKLLLAESSSNMKSGQSLTSYLVNCCGDPQKYLPSFMTLNVCCISKKNLPAASAVDRAIRKISSYMSSKCHDYGDAADDGVDELMPQLSFSTLIPFRASDVPTIRQQIQRYNDNLAKPGAGSKNVASLIEQAMQEWKTYISLFPEKKDRKHKTLASYKQEFMKELRTIAFKNPRLFFVRGPVGEPYTTYGFLLDLHMYREGFPSKTEGGDVNTGTIIDFWQILCFLKLGLLRSLLDMLFPEMPEDGDNKIDSVSEKDGMSDRDGVSVIAELTRRYKTAELEAELTKSYQRKNETAAKPGDGLDAGGTGFVGEWIDSLSIAADYIEIHSESGRKFSQFVTESSSQSSASTDDLSSFIETNIFQLFARLRKRKEAAVGIICAVECEFQWLLCQEYSPNIFPVEDMLISSQHSSGSKVSIINEYTGENVLHLLIIRGHLRSIENLCKLVSCTDYKQHMISSKVTGRFFCPIYGEVDYGQTPLHFAVCTGQLNVVKHILECWCVNDFSRYTCLWQKDSRGNSVLHLCVLNMLCGMYDFLEFAMRELEKDLKSLEWWHHEHRLTISDDDCLKNFQYYTPIELAAIKGHANMLAHLIDKEKHKKWSYGGATLNAIRVRDLDSFKTLTCPREPEVLQSVAQQTEPTVEFLLRKFNAAVRNRNEVEPSVLAILIDKEQKQLMNIPVIKGLIDFKWVTFGQTLLIYWASVSFAVFVLFEVVCYNIIYPSGQAGLVFAPNIPFSGVEVLLYFIAIVFLICRQLFQIDSGISMQKPDSAYSTFDIDTSGVDISKLVYPSEPSWKLGLKLRNTVETHGANFSGKTVEHYAHEMLGNSFRMGKIQPHSVTLVKELSGKYIKLSNALMPLSLFTKILWRVTGQDMMKEGGLWGVAWCILVLLSAVIRLTLPDDVKSNAEQISLALASVCIFFYMTGFYSFSDKLGPFMVLLQHMFMDLFKWLSIAVLFFLGYAQAMLMITSDTSISVLGTYKWLLGDSSTDEVSESSAMQGLIIFLFISYSILVSIALVNILTAMFGSTYGKIMENSHETWFLESVQQMPSSAPVFTSRQVCSQRAGTRARPLLLTRVSP
jgi:hypothetical protein